MTGFYYLARLTLVKDERHLDRFDRAFAEAFAGWEALEASAVLAAVDLPPGWLQRMAAAHLTPEERAAIEALGGFDRLMETLKARLAEQQGRHQGGNKWIGTAGTSPFGAHGYNPEGVRIGQDASRRQRAVKVGDRREFRNLDASVELGTRTLKLALKRLGCDEIPAIPSHKPRKKNAIHEINSTCPACHQLAGQPLGPCW